jgi:hypothetical protein
MAAETSGDAKVPVELGLFCYWLKNPPIRNIRARFYDMAAETSGDAKVPVALALAKLAVVFAWKNAEELKLIIGKLLYYQSLNCHVTDLFL